MSDFLQLRGKTFLVFGVANRKSVAWFVAKCRTASGSKYDLPVMDLSAGGCLVELGFRGFKLGERVLVGLPGLSAIPGEVVWIEEKDAGIAFEAVLHEAVLENLTAARQR